ncbi:ABC transporter ATP-binding protein [Paenibacillus polymyxa]|uniref:ABC transporter ATP-binding protein n=1 Tax=Paenibacillus polymyxa TaxID=1406 RepID=UPI001BE9C298|nr:ABC transporter ATP-binding protein [Paenibacillus polymyxa]MBT2282459.1 ABC transporter ATP-binding protein [Paenibacillus polymyxa]
MRRYFRQFNDLFVLLQIREKTVVPYAIGIIIDCLLTSAVSVSMAFGLQAIVDAIVDEQTARFWSGLSIITFGFCIAILVSPFFAYLTWKTIKHWSYEMRNQLVAHLMRMPLLYYDRNHGESVLSLFTNDLVIVEKTLTDRLRNYIYYLVLGIVTIGAMMWLDMRLAIILILVNGGLQCINVLLNRRLKVQSDKVQALKAILSERYIDIFHGSILIKMFPKSQYLRRRYEQGASELVSDTTIFSGLAAIRDGINALSGFIGFGGLLVAGVFLIADGRLDLGTLMAFIQLQFNISFVLVQLGTQYSQVIQGISGAKRIRDFLSEVPEKDHGKGALVATQKQISFHQVSFQFENSNQGIKEASFTISTGQNVSIVGASGSGKSTILKLLLGFYRPTAGNITLGDMDLEEVQPSIRNDLMALVSQDPYIFPGTVEENVRLGNMQEGMNQIYEAAKKANAHQFIMELPHGYQTLLGNGGASLSGGQKQRIAIARAILKSAPILILDEATSALDEESSRIVSRALEQFMKDRTTISVTHKIDETVKSDLVLVFDGGKLIQYGSPETLMKQKGKYRSLYNVYHTS